MSEPNLPDRTPLHSVQTLEEAFQSWERFWSVYYEPIKEAFGLMPFVGADDAGDAVHGFFLKLRRSDLLRDRPAIRQRFRDWLYVAAHHYAVDEWRRQRPWRERPAAFDVLEPADPRPAIGDDLPFDADEFYALSVLHLTVRRVRTHCLREGMAEHWMIFEELVLAPLIPGRLGRTRDELLAMFPNERPNFLNNRITTVYRAFCRILPALIPVDPTEVRTAEQRFQELLSILRASARSRLWLALLQAPTPGDSPDSSIELAVRSIGGIPALAISSAETLHDELRILLGFWLEMPLAEYLEGPEVADPAVSAAIRHFQPANEGGLPSGFIPSLNLRMLVDETNPAGAIPVEQLTVLLGGIKSFAKRIHRPRKRRPTDRGDAGQLEDSMPFEITQVLYNLAGALALIRCGVRIVGLDDGQFRKNLHWALNQAWLDPTLRPTYFAAVARLSSAATD